MKEDRAPAAHVDLEGFRSDLREAGIEAMVGAILQTFFEDCPTRFSALEAAVRLGDPKEIESAAHALKSSSATIRAYVLSELLAAVEASALAGRVEFIPPQLERIRSEHVAVLRELEAVINNTAAVEAARPGTA